MEKYISKDAAIAEIERLKKDEGWCQVGKDTADVYYARGFRFACEIIINALNTLEVKEVELDMKTFGEEMTNVFNLPSNETTNTEEEPLNWEYAIAKHFFELGLKVQKGE